MPTSDSRMRRSTGGVDAGPGGACVQAAGLQCALRALSDSESLTRDSPARGE